MKIRKNGFTLVEVIVSIAIIGMIAVGIIPAFGAQFKMTVAARELTSKTFEAQGVLEDAMLELKNVLAKGLALPTDVTQVEMTVFNDTEYERTVDMYQLKKPYPANPNKFFTVFLSKKMADMEAGRKLLAAPTVELLVMPGSLKKTAANSETETLAGQVLTTYPSDSGWYLNLYDWYVSKEGLMDPEFPNDYVNMHIGAGKQTTLSDLSLLSNRYVILRVTPVDANGVRGNSGYNVPPVYVLGPEWRTGTYAWVDKNLDAKWQDTDVKIDKSGGGYWPLLAGFNTEDGFEDPLLILGHMDTKDGALYVPMGVRHPTLGLLPSDIDVSNAEKTDWTVDKSIHLAAHLSVKNNTDIRMETKDGSIILYQFVKINPVTKQCEYDVNGMPVLIDQGPVLSTGGNIDLKTSGRGEVILQEKSALKAGGKINLTPYGGISIKKSELSGEEITLDTTKGAALSGNRDILVENTTFTLNPDQDNGKAVSLAARSALTARNSTFNGNPGKDNRVSFTAVDGNNLSEVTLANIKAELASHTKLIGGGWDGNSIVKVADGKTLTVQKGGNKVQNGGSLVLGNTGGIRFGIGMGNDLQVPLQLDLVTDAGNPNEITVQTNYGRNVSYADPQDFETATAIAQDLGSGLTNLQYSVEKINGADATILCAYDGNNRITVQATSAAGVGYYRLTVTDQYAPDISGTAVIQATTSGGGVVPTIPEWPVVFMKNDGTSAVHATISVMEGSPIGSKLPGNPSRAGFNFSGWKTLGGVTVDSNTVVVDGSMVAYAQWTAKIMYTVQFDSQGGTAVPSRVVEKDNPIGLLPTPTRPNYKFLKWTTDKNGNNDAVTAETIVTGDMTLYAQWTKLCVVTFDAGPYGVPQFSTKLVNPGKKIGTLNTATRLGHILKGWKTSANVLITTDTVINEDMTVYAVWEFDSSRYKKFSASTIAVGAYMNTFDDNGNKVLFQKIGIDRMLTREKAIGSGTANWTTTNGFAGTYYKSFSNLNSPASSWVVGSGLLDYDTLDGLNKKDIRKVPFIWWAESASSANAYRVNTAGNVGQESKTIGRLCRPYIKVNNASLYVDTAGGSGTSALPYPLVWIITD